MPPLVDFYILDGASKQKSLLFACQLLEKIYHDQQTAFVHTTSKEEAEYIEGLLWTYRDDSFIPHTLYTTSPSSAPIQIGYEQEPQQSSTVLLNLSLLIPPFYMQFSRVIEIVYADANMQQLARERFRRYREQGCLLNTMK